MWEKQLIDLLHLERARVKDDEIIASCPYAAETHLSGKDSNPSFALNIAKGVFNCFSCGARGTIEELVAFSLGTTLSEATDILLDLGYDRLEIAVEKATAPKPTVDEVIIPEGMLDEFTLVDAAAEIYRGNIDSKDCYIFAVRNHEGFLVGGLVRSVEGRFHKNLWHIPKKKYLYGEHQIIEGKPIIIVEGPGDRTALTKAGVDNVVALMGAFISEEQTEKLLAWTSEVVVWLDNDPAGYEGTLRVHRRLDLRTTVRYTNILALDVKDPKEYCEKYGAAATIEFIDTAKTWLEMVATTFLGGV